MRLLAMLFQSHNGAIAAKFGGTNQAKPAKSFNPTMVRLLPSSGGFCQLGAKYRFNPTMVRLLLESRDR